MENLSSRKRFPGWYAGFVYLVSGIIIGRMIAQTAEKLGWL